MPVDGVNDNSSYALKRIRLLLEPGQLGGDRKLPTERALAERLEVSRRAVRLALEVLEAEGRIWRRQGSGTFVGPAPAPSLEGIEDILRQSSYLDVMEVRLRFEPHSARLAARRAGPSDIERLRSLLDHISGSRDADERELWDSSLHRTVAEISGNRIYLAIFDLVDKVRQEQAWIEMRERARNKGTLLKARAHHQAIVDAIARQDAEAAEQAMREHLQALFDNLGRSSTRDLGHVS